MSRTPRPKDTTKTTIRATQRQQPTTQNGEEEFISAELRDKLDLEDMARIARHDCSLLLHLAELNQLAEGGLSEELRREAWGAIEEKLFRVRETIETLFAVAWAAGAR